MWQKFRKREEAIKAYYKDKGEPARDHLPRTAVDGVISWEPVSMHWNIILSLHLETMPCWVWLQVCQRKERSCQDVIIPPHPTPPNLETMPCWVWLQVCQRKERNCQDVIIPPHPTPPPRIWRRCHVECGHKCVRGRNAAARTLLSHPTAPHPPHPTPPHLETMPCWVWPQVCQRKERSCQDVIIPPHPTPPHLETMPCWVWLQVWQRKERTSQDVIIPPHPTASGDDAMLSVATSVSKEGTQLPGRYYPTPPHPTPPHLETMPCWVWPQVCQRKERSCQDVIIPPHPTPHLETMLCWLWPQLWRGCWFLSRADGGWGMAFFWLWNPLVLVAESPFFGCGIAFFWLRNRLFWLRN